MYNISYNLVGLVFLIVLTIYFFKIPIFPNRSNTVFKAILVLSCLSIGLDISTAVIVNNSESYSIAMQYVSNTVFFLVYWPLAFFFLHYTILLTKRENLINSKVNIVLNSLMVIEMIIIALSPLFHTIFYIDPVGGYTHGFLYVPIAILNVIIVFSAGLLVLINRRSFTIMQRTAIPMYILILCVANIVQVYYPFVYVTGAALALSTFIMFLTLQNPNIYYDSLTMVFSRESLEDYLSKLVHKKEKFQIIIVDVVNTTNINRTLGERAGSEIISQTAKRIKSSCPNNLIFRLEGDAFVIFTKSEERRDKLIEKFKKQFPFNYKIDTTQITVHVHLNYSETLSKFESTAEAIGVIQDCAKSSKKNKISLINESSLDEIKRIRSVEKALQRAIDEKDFSVYIQPIYNTTTGLFEKAEALVRIKDDELGLIMPNEFIEIAEKNRMIKFLTPVVIEQVCKFIHSSSFPSTFKAISINLSVIDCLDENLDKFILSMIDKYEIDPSRLIFEITETVASLAPQVTITMKSLQKHGVKFSLDDFGSGYANIDAVVKLPFNIIKIDRELVLLLHDVRYKVMLEGLVKIMLNLDYDIIVEGIETEEQAGVLDGMGAHVHQGYLYSRPVPMDVFTRVINDNATIKL